MAAHLGISAWQIRQICENHRVPFPTAAFWRDRAAGKRARQAIFTSTMNAALELITLNPTSPSEPLAAIETPPAPAAKPAADLGRITCEATKIDPDATAQTFPAIPAEGDGEIFKNIDTATSRARIGSVNSRVAGQKIAIIGLGGTGSYVLDLVTKTPVAETHMFDGDVFSQHNAFRCPGAAGHAELAAKRPRRWSPSRAPIRRCGEASSVMTSIWTRSISPCWIASTSSSSAPIAGW